MFLHPSRQAARTGTWLIAVLGLAQAISCRTSDVPLEPQTGGLRAEIADGGHNDGNSHFFFLPPIVAQPAYSGVFDPTASPVVQICERTSSGCETPPVAEYTMTSGPGAETVRLDATDEYYIVNWPTHGLPPDAPDSYRISVLIGATELGHADVDLATSQRELRQANTDLYVSLIRGATLPIKFRIEQGAIPAIPQFTGVLRDRDGAPLPGQYVSLSGPPEASTQTAADGAFSLAVTPGTYTLHVSSGTTPSSLPGMFGVTGPSLTLNTDQAQDLTLQNVFLHVTVLDASGNPVPNTSLSATGNSAFDLFPGGPASGSFITGGSTDAAGEAQLGLLASSSVTVTATPPPGLPQTSVTVSALSDASITITLGGP